MENQSQTVTYAVVTDLVKSRVLVDDNFKLIKSIWGLSGQMQFQSEDDAISKLKAAATNHYSTLRIAS